MLSRELQQIDLLTYPGPTRDLPWTYPRAVNFNLFSTSDDKVYISKRRLPNRFKFSTSIKLLKNYL